MTETGSVEPSASTATGPTAAAPGPRQKTQRATFIPRGREARLEAGEDYALRKVPGHFKRTPMGFAMPLTGLSWSMFFFAVGGTLALSFGFASTMVALGITTVIGLLGLMTLPRLAARYSLSLDLLTRGSGYGFLGSAVTSFVYALNWLMYAGLEAAFMASALHTQWSGVPLAVWYVFTSLITIPFNWYGVTQNDFFQRITFPLFIAGLVWLMIKVLGRSHHASFGSPGITLTNVLGALGALLPNVVIQILGTCDFARFLPRRDTNKGLWLGSVAVILLVYLVSMPVGAVLALYSGTNNPGVY